MRDPVIDVRIRRNQQSGNMRIFFYVANGFRSSAKPSGSLMEYPWHFLDAISWGNDGCHRGFVHLKNWYEMPAILWALLVGSHRSQILRMNVLSANIFRRSIAQDSWNSLAHIGHQDFVSPSIVPSPWSANDDMISLSVKQWIYWKTETLTEKNHDVTGVCRRRMAF
jgi:hypothetical protein